jgi:hypothetical protein
MSFDISRVSFNPKNDYQGVVMQQGRVQLDSDWNEWQAEFSRRLQAGTLDVFGRAAYPASTPAAFKIKISPSGESLTIGAGRMYVDGLLAENHGTLPPAFTVVAAASLENPGAYAVQLTPGSGAGSFNLSLLLTSTNVPTQVGVTLNNLTLANVQAAVDADSTLSQYIHLQNVAVTGVPQALTANTRYLLVPNGPDYAVTIPCAAAVLWDPALAELSEAPFIAGTPEFDIDYAQQPYLPNAQIPGVGPYLVYLDVWQRDITSLQQPALIEPAVGVDTTGRLQTVWQVKLLDVSHLLLQGRPVTCSTPDADIPAWANLLLPPGGNLSTGVVQSAPQGPCSLTPNTSYTGVENQLYRVEIHQPGQPASGTSLPVGNPAVGTATFKWSRDNASVATAVSGITSAFNTAGAEFSKLTVQSLGRDQVLGFQPGDWIEITDDYLELNGAPGELHQIDSISVPDSTISLVDAIASPANFPTSNLLTNPERHTRITRWDQQGKVYASDGSTLYFDLGNAASGGAIPVPPAGATLVLENGVTVNFGVNPGGQFKTGDYWNFAARAADGTVETLVQAPPLGIHHHYARLAIVDFASPLSNPADCRLPWPPAAANQCGCKVTVQVSDLTAQRTLQSILDQYAGVQSAVIISLMPGTYLLPSPLRLGARYAGITLEACQPGSAILQAQQGQESHFLDGLIVLDGTSGITLSGLQFVQPIVPYTAATFAGLPAATVLIDMEGQPPQGLPTFTVSLGVRSIGCTNLAIEDCQFQLPNLSLNRYVANLSAGIFAGGTHTGLQVVGNQFTAAGTGAYGFLLAPSVAFAPPAAPTQFKTLPLFVPAIPAFNLAAAATLPASTGAKIMPASVVSSTALNAGAAAAPAAMLNPAAAAPPPPSSQASGGGAVLPAVLDEAVFKENTFTGLQDAIFILAATQAVQIVSNQVTGNGGFCLLAPLSTSASSCPWYVWGYPLPQGSTAVPTAIAPLPPAMRVYAGTTGSPHYKDSQQNTWIADVEAATTSGLTFSGNYNTQGAQFQIYEADGKTPDPDATLYQSERYGNFFVYTFSGLAAGFYRVTLKFAEIFGWATREANIAINGNTVLTAFNVFTDIGGANRADDKLFVNAAVPANGQLTIAFTMSAAQPAGAVPQPAKISAIAVEPMWGSSSPNLAGQLVLLGAQGYAGLAASSSRLRFAHNDVRSTSIGNGLLVSGDDSLVNGKGSSLLVVGNRFESAIPDYATGVIINAVTRCVVTGNIIAYDASSVGSNVDQVALTLDTSALSPGQGTPGQGNTGLTNSAFVAVSVTGNVLQGTVNISSPPLAPGGTAPAPMNQWAFFNTVIT